jgi:hypothetical protein|tara:strand:+ start:10369 stop:10767 length:399 start_codon:yes stop_codon:yes gene_type:complete
MVGAQEVMVAILSMIVMLLIILIIIKKRENIKKYTKEVVTMPKKNVEVKKDVSEMTAEEVATLLEKKREQELLALEQDKVSDLEETPKKEEVKPVEVKETNDNSEVEKLIQEYRELNIRKLELEQMLNLDLK